MTKSHGSRAIAVVISSTMPSAKYCCSGSLDRLRNGRTTMDSRGGGDDTGAGSCASRTMPIKRTPFRGKVRIHRCAAPLSPSALRAAFMRAASAESETIRPPHTACSRSSLLTTRSRFCTR